MESKIDHMYTEEEEYEDVKSWREDLKLMDRYMDILDQLLEEEIKRLNQSIDDDEENDTLEITDTTNLF